MWDFLTPLAATQLWFLVRHHPELDGSDLVAPAGQNPEVCIFHQPDHSYIGIYTAECRAEEICAQWKISTRDWIPVSAKGYPLLRYLSGMDHSLCINAGLAACQNMLDPDLVDILLSRPEPPAEAVARHVSIKPEDDPKKHLGPLTDFLRGQPTVRAAWILGQEPDSPLPAGHHSYEIGLVMEDPDDDSLLDKVGVMAKALTPVEMEWTTAVMMADDKSLRNLAKQRRPFYEAHDFLRKKSPHCANPRKAE